MQVLRRQRWSSTRSVATRPYVRATTRAAPTLQRSFVASAPASLGSVSKPDGGAMPVSAAAAALHKCVEASEWEQAVQVLKAWPPWPGGRGGQLADGSADEAAQLLLDAYDATLVACEGALRWESALGLFHAMPRRHLRPGARAVACAIRSAAPLLRWSSALHLLARSWRQRLELDASASMRAQFGCQKGGAWHLVVGLLTELRKRGAELEEEHFLCTLRACREQRQWELVLHYFESMQSEGVVPGGGYDEVLKGCAISHRWQAALTLLLEAWHAGAAISMGSTYPTVLDACFDTGHAVSPSVAAKLFQGSAWEVIHGEPEGLKRGVLPVEVLDGHEYLRPGVELAMRRWLADTVLPSLRLWGASSAAVLEQRAFGRRFCRELLSTNEQAFPAADVATLGFESPLDPRQGCKPFASALTLYEAPVASEDTSVTDISPTALALAVWLEFRLDFRRCGQPGLLQGPGHVVGYAGKGQLWRGQWMDVLGSLQELSEQSLEPDLSAFQFLLHHLSKAKRWQQALLVLSWMEREAVEPDVIAWNMVMAACTRGQEWRSALVLMEAIRDRELEPTIVSYSTAMTACANGSQWEMALGVLEEVRSSGHEADVVLYGAAITACRRVRHWQGALALLHCMRDGGVQASVVAYSAAVAACSAYWTVSLQLLHDMHSERVKPDAIVLAACISSAAWGIQWAGALHLLRETQQRGLTPNAISYVRAASACAKGSQWLLGLAIMAEGRSAGVSM